LDEALNLVYSPRVTVRTDPKALWRGTVNVSRKVTSVLALIAVEHFFKSEV
jgi:hypothetical protein